MTDAAHHILGLPSDASAVEIKRAFRRLAMQWHPDRNPAPEAAAQFRRLRHARDTLLAAINPASSSAADRQHPRGADRHLDITIDLDIVFSGGRRQIQLEPDEPCEACSGQGQVTLSLSRLCEPCRGSGRLRVNKRLEPCRSCQGRGFVHVASCSQCSGTGHSQQCRQLAVELPPGLTDGDILRLAGEGEPPGDGDGMAGDLQLHIRLAPHPLYRCEGRDLHLERPLSSLQLLLGGCFSIPHPLGIRHVELAAGDARPRQLRIAGAGVPARGRQPAGDLHIRLQPQLPSAADADLCALLAQAEQHLQTHRTQFLPEVAAWEQRWLDAQA